MTKLVPWSGHFALRNQGNTRTITRREVEKFLGKPIENKDDMPPTRHIQSGFAENRESARHAQLKCVLKDTYGRPKYREILLPKEQGRDCFLKLGLRCSEDSVVPFGEAVRR